MKRGNLAILALFFPLIVCGRPALALDTDDVKQLAKISSQEYFLEEKCNLVANAALFDKYADKYIELHQGQKTKNDPAYAAWQGQLDKFSEEYALLSLQLPAKEFCDSLKSDYVSIGGGFIEKSGSQN